MNNNTAKKMGDFRYNSMAKSDY